MDDVTSDMVDHCLLVDLVCWLFPDTNVLLDLIAQL